MLDRTFAKLASVIAKASGRPLVFLLACFSVIVWAAAGPFFHLSDTWQLVINTTSSIVTFLMVFVIQNTQVRDNAALNAKLDNILKVMEGTDKRLIGVENLTDREIEELRSPPLAR
jgi:low affinity Fe/Cu permease